MNYKFRTDSIHLELELLAKEFDNALPPNKNNEAAFLLWFMENYPNAELWRAFPIVKKNFQDWNLGSPVRRKCARMLGEIGTTQTDSKATFAILWLLLEGMKDNDPHMVCEAINAVGRMAEARKWQDFDHMILPLLERIVDCDSPNSEPNILDAALDALSKIKPNDPGFLDDIGEVKGELGRKKHRQGKTDAWDSKIRRLEEVRRGWASLLIQRGKWDPKKAGVPAPKANAQPARQGNNRGKQGKGRRIVTP